MSDRPEYLDGVVGYLVDDEELVKVLKDDTLSLVEMIIKLEDLGYRLIKKP